jgi:DNA polymerase epsilon subunit 1
LKALDYCHVLLSIKSSVLFSVPASRSEYQTIRQQLEVEKIPGLKPGDPYRTFHSLLPAEQAQLEKKRLGGT